MRIVGDILWMPKSFTFIHLLIHSGYLYRASSSPLLLKSSPDTVRILRRGFTPKYHRQLRVKDLPKVPMWWLERESNPRPFGRKVTNLPMSHHVPRLSLAYWYLCNTWHV